jgi:hypothetical protein
MQRLEEAFARFASSSSPRLADEQTQRHRELLRRLADVVVDAPETLTRYEQVCVSMALRAYVSGEPLEPARGRGNPELVAKGLRNPMWAAFLVQLHLDRNPGTRPNGAHEAVAFDLGVDVSTVRKADARWAPGLKGILSLIEMPRGLSRRKG